MITCIIEKISLDGFHSKVMTLNQSVTSRSREFCSFLDGTGTGKNWSRGKVPVLVKFVPEKNTGPGTGKNWSRKKVPVLVPEKMEGCENTFLELEKAL